MITLNLYEMPWMRGRLPYRINEMDAKIARESIVQAERNCACTKLRTALNVTRETLRKGKHVK